MQTKRKYYENTYLYEDTAFITDINSDEKGTYVILNETIFHPQGGGQPSDIGTINDCPITKVVISKVNHDEIKHYLSFPEDQPLKVGDQVKLLIDSQKRLKYACLHTAGHLLANVLRKLQLLDAANISTVRSHHFPLEAYFQIKLADASQINTEELKEQIFNEMLNLIAKNLAVATMIDNNVRYMKIEGFVADPCGGTHLNNVGEIKNFSIRNIRNNKDGLRIGYDSQ